MNNLKKFLLLSSLLVTLTAGSLFIYSLSHAQLDHAEPPLVRFNTSPTPNNSPSIELEPAKENLSTLPDHPRATAVIKPEPLHLSPTNPPRSIENSIPAFTPTPTLPKPIPWSGGSRINILLLGLDYGEWESSEREGPPRSDTMVLVSIDNEAREAGILTIPRDLWVEIPGMVRPNKINAAYRFGEHYNLPGGGPGLAMRTVEQLVGVPIDFYIEIDFYAFEKIIDEIGGIEVEVEEEIKVHRLAPMGSVILEPGMHSLDGATALAYARNRSTLGGDFDRSERQQQIMMSARDAILKFDKLPRLVLRAPAIYREVSTGVKTNLPLDKIIQLAWLGQSIPKENVRQEAIGPGEISYGRSADGQSILVPVPFRIQQKVNQVISIPTTNPDLIKRMQAEEARLFIINASGTEDLADLTASYLSSKGAIVMGKELGGKIISQTSIIDFTGKPYTMQYLTRMMTIPFSAIEMDFDPDREEDILIILGTDWQWKSSFIR